ncbi:MAG: hypothetical protein GXO05_04905 [Aquificae bacterium]|nr:hypothetical protein [Aquificota bacterium]
MKKLFINLLIGISILILSLSLIILTTLFLWENRKVILSAFGVKLEDNCSVSGLQLTCGSIDFSTKNLHFQFKNLNAKVDITTIFDKSSPILYLSIEEGKGQINAPDKKRSSPRRNNPFLILYYGIYFVKSDINRFDLTITRPDGNKIQVEDFSFVTDYDSFRVKRPFQINFDGINIKIQELSGSILPDSLIIERVSTFLNNNPVEIKGKIDYRGDFEFTGRFYGNSFVYSGLFLKDFDLDFFIKKTGKLFTGKAYWKADSLRYKNLEALRTGGRLHFAGSESIKGNLNTTAEIVRTGKVILDSPVVRAGYSYKLDKKDFTSEGRITIPEISFGRINLKNVMLDFSVRRGERFSVRGSVKTGKLSTQYTLENRLLIINTDRFYVKDLLKETGLYNKKLERLDALAWGEIQIDFSSRTTTADFSFRGIDLFGVVFDEGRVHSEIDNSQAAGIYTLNLSGKNSFGFVNGSFRKNFIEADITVDNLDISGLVFGKKLQFGGEIDGNGHISGYLPDFSLNFSGTAHSFYYRNLKVRDYSFALEYYSDIKKLSVDFSDRNKSIKGLFSLGFQPFSMKLDLKLRQADVSFSGPFLKEMIPAIFSTLTPSKATGSIGINVEKKQWKVDVEIPEARVVINPASDFVYTQVSGSLSKEKKQMHIKFWRENFRLKDYTLGEINGRVDLNNGTVNTELSIEGLSGFDKFSAGGWSRFGMEDRSIKGRILLDFKKGEFQDRLNTEFSGHLKKISGFIQERGFYRGKKAVETDINYTLHVGREETDISLSTDKLQFFLPENLKLQFYRIYGRIKIPYKRPVDATGKLEMEKFTASKNYLYFFDSSPVEVVLKNGKITGSNARFTGIIQGEIKGFEYDLLKNRLKLISEGKIDKNLLSVLLRYANASGDIFYSLHYDGKINDYASALNCSITSDNLNLKTAYTIGILNISKLLMRIKKGSIRAYIRGKSPDVVLGESSVTVDGTGSLVKKFFTLSADTRFLPVKYQNIFQGNLSSNIKTKTFLKEGQLETQVRGRLSVSGKVRLEDDLNKLLKKRKESGAATEDKNLENVTLDLSVESYIPIYLYGKWGKAYAEFNLDVKGTAAKPVANGDISIIYGEIYFMKNKYNIDFANIKIIQNEPYISARISTSIADTFIFIDLSGSAYNPRINFSSSPPKSKDEILSILLLRDTPSALENMPVFKTVGKLLYTLLPFKPSEERGLFNTGFEINILPQYSPTAGISASLYAKRNLTRRIFIALSTPIGQVEEGKRTGWYGFGIRLKERSSFQYKFFETGNQEFDIVFNFPFDF